MTRTLFSTQQAIDLEQFYAERSIATGHRLLDAAVAEAPFGALWVVRGPWQERTSIVDQIVAASLTSGRSIAYASLHRPSSSIGLSIVANVAGTTVGDLVRQTAVGEKAVRAFQLREHRLFDVVGSNIELKAGLQHCVPPTSGRPLDLLVIDGPDVAPERVLGALDLNDFSHGEAEWIGALRAFARRHRTTVLMATGPNVKRGAPDPDIGVQDILIEVGSYDERETEFPVTVTQGRFSRTSLFATWIPRRAGLTWRRGEDRV